MRDLTRLKHFFSLILLVQLFLPGCADLVAPTTSNPYDELKLAAELFDNMARPLPAEHLIKDAIETFEQNNDETGLAEAYRYYGFFFRSSSLALKEKHYRDHGFLDKKATFEKRIERAIFYFKKARDLYEKNNQFARVANLYLNLGYAYHMINDIDTACAAFDMSYLAYQQSRRLTPESKLVLPKKFRSYVEYIAFEKNRLKCP